MNMKKIVSIVSLMLVIALFSTVGVCAATNAPYKDVTTKTVDSNSINAITYVKSHSGYKGVIKGQKFYPKKKITKREYIAILANFYGKKNVPVNINDVLGANGKVTAKWATNKMSQVAKKKAKINMTWTKLPKGTLSRADAARYIKIFATFDKALKPIK